MQSVSFENIIRSHIRLGRPNPGGWHPTLCKVCNDHGKKGDRAAFKFDGDTVGYHCFNCGISTMYDPEKHRRMPKKMVEILTAFGIPDREWQMVVFKHLGTARRDDSGSHQILNIEPAEIDLPQNFLQLGIDTSSNDDVAEYAKEYLAERGIDWQSYPFYISNHTSKKWFGRLIIPIYKDKKVVFYQGRDLSGLQPQRYLSPVADKSKILYGYENLHTNIDEPLYVVEGFFDAFLLGGVALFGNQLYDPQIKWLNQSRREKVIIPDRYGDGQILANKAIEIGWSVSTPDAPGCKDVSDIVKKYGMLYTLRSIHTNTFKGFEAQIRTKMYCGGG